MALLETPKAELGSLIPNFDLPGTDGKNYSPENFKGAKALVVVFTCNHCPYAQGVKPLLHELYEKFKEKQVQFVAINPNDAENYPEDSLDKMKEEKYDYPFPYLQDESQTVAREFGAVCTPDIFVYGDVGVGRDRPLLAYRGRVTDNWQNPEEAKTHDLNDALEALAKGEKPTAEQFPSMGCSIKWK